LLYQGFLTGIVRLQAGRQELGQPELFRKRMQIALKDVHRDAVGAGYAPEDVGDAEFAVVAFLDEVVLSSEDPNRHEWSKQTLSVELFKEADAGEVFFDRLESYRSRRDAPQLADLLEVYLLCLMLGFQGRYVNMPGERHAIADRTYRRIQGIHPLTPSLFPEATVSTRHEAISEPPLPPKEWRTRLVWILAGCLLFFILCWLHLTWAVSKLGDSVGGLG
jgi:type VI secretion system protein ImpK